MPCFLGCDSWPWSIVAIIKMSETEKLIELDNCAQNCVFIFCVNWQSSGWFVSTPQKRQQSRSLHNHTRQNTSNSASINSNLCPHLKKIPACHLRGTVGNLTFQAPVTVKPLIVLFLIIICYTLQYLCQQRHLHLACRVSPSSEIHSSNVLPLPSDHWEAPRAPDMHK